MLDSLLPSAAIPAALPPSVRPKIVSPTSEPPHGDGWLHEVKHDGHRLIAIVAGHGSIKLLSRNGVDRTLLFRVPFVDLAARGRQLVLDGEIAVPDHRGVTHIDALNDALGGRPDRFTYFGFDLLHLDGHDLRGCPIEHRKALLKALLDDAGSERIVYVDHIVGNGARLFEHVRAVGAEGIVSKRLGHGYRGGQGRDWLKTKCHQIGRFTIIGFQEIGPGRLEAIHVAEEVGGKLVPAGQIRFGFAGKGLWDRLDQHRCGESERGIVPVGPGLAAEIKFFGRHKGGTIRDGVILELVGVPVAGRRRPGAIWDCDSASVVAAMS